MIVRWLICLYTYFIESLLNTPHCFGNNMGTRGRIAVHCKGRIVFCIWVRYDAYPSHTGKIILEKLRHVEQQLPRDVDPGPQVESTKIGLGGDVMTNAPLANRCSMAHSLFIDTYVQTLGTLVNDNMKDYATREKQYANQFDTFMQETVQNIWCEHLYIIHVEPDTLTEITYANTFDGFRVQCHLNQFEHIVECDGIWENIHDNVKTQFASMVHN